VADTPSQLKKSERNEALREAAGRYAGTALSIGATLEQATDELEQSFDRLMREHRRKA
jgi:hypothetical protein